MKRYCARSSDVPLCDRKTAASKPGCRGRHTDVTVGTLPAPAARERCVSAGAPRRPASYDVADLHTVHRPKTKREGHPPPRAFITIIGHRQKVGKLDHSIFLLCFFCLPDGGLEPRIAGPRAKKLEVCLPRPPCVKLASQKVKCPMGGSNPRPQG